MSLAFSDVNAGVGAFSKPEQPHPGGSNAAVAIANIQEPSRNVTARISNQIVANASKSLLSNGIDYNISHQICQSIPSHYQYQHPALDICEMQVSRATTSIIENKQDQVSDQGQNLAQTGQIVPHGFAQTQTQSSAPMAPVAKSHRKRCTQPGQNNHRDQNIPKNVQIHNLAVGQSQSIMQDRRSIPTSADAQPQASNHGRAPVNGSNQVQGGNGYPNLASPSRTPLSTSSTAPVSLSTNTPSSLSNVPSISNPNVSADTSRDVNFSPTGIVAASGTAARSRGVGFDAESGSPHVNQTDVDLNTINNSDANASMDVRNLNESSASSHCENTWLPRGMDKASGSGCLPQSSSQNQTHIASQPRSGIQMSSPQLKKRKRESTLGPERGEPNSFSQGHPVSQPIPPSLRTVSPSLSSNSTANGVKTTEEVRLVPSMDAVMLPNSNLTPLSDTVIGSDIVIPNQLSGVKTTQFVDHGTVSDSEANANVAFGPSGDVAFATVYREVAQPGFDPLPVTTQSTETILVHDYHQPPTPSNPRRDPHFAQKVGNVLQNLVATTGIDSRLVLRFSKELHASKTELRRRDANEAGNAIVAEQSAVNHVNQAHIDSISSAFVEKLSQKDHEINCLVQELRNSREQYGAVIRTLEAERSQLHSVLSAKENENQILVERNRHLEVQLSAMQTDKTRMINHCRFLENTLNKHINNNYPGSSNFPTQLFINSPTTPGTPISPINQQPSFPHVSPHPVRRESISTVSTTPTQGSEQGMPPLTRTALTAPVPRAKAMPRAGSNEIQLHEQQGYGRVPPGPSSSRAELNLNHQFQQMELARQHHHPQTGNISPSFTPPPLSQFPSAQHQQSQQVSAVAQYQKQLLDKQGGAQDQLIGNSGHAHRSQLPGPPSHIHLISRKQLLARHVEQVRPTVHEQTTRRYSEPVITHGTNIKRGFQRPRIVSNQYPVVPRPPQIYTQLPVSQVPTPVNAVSTQPLNFPPPGPSKTIPLSYMAESFSQSSVQPVRQEIQKSVPPMPHTGDTEMQQPSPLQSQMQALPIKQGTQPTEVHSSLSKSSGDSRFDVIDLTFDEDQINTDTDGPPKKRLKADRDKDTGNQSAPSTPTDPPAPLMIVVDDVKVETENEAMAIDGEPVTERHADVPCASPSTLSNPSNELPVQSSIIHGIDISNPEVVDYLNEAFLALSKEDNSLRYCFCCQFRTEGDPADCPEITRLRDPTIEDILNHLREEHSTVFEGIRSGNFLGEQEQVQAE